MEQATQFSYGVSSSCRSIYTAHSMKTQLIQLQERIETLEKLGDEVHALSERFFRGESVQPDFSFKGERWYRGAREILVQQSFSGLKDFDECYSPSSSSFNMGAVIHHTHVREYNAADSAKKWFDINFRTARGLIGSVSEEIISREMPMKSALSLALSADEFDTAQELLNVSRGDEGVLRAAGVIARVALERHLFTVAELKKLTIQVNPPSKRKADASDLISTLAKAGVITGIQQSELEGLFRIANNCAHPKETITQPDVKRLIERSRELAALIV